MNRLRMLFSALSAASILCLVSGCGYTLQNSHSELADKEGVRKIYVMPLVNNTYKPGVENTIYNALVQTLSVHRRVRLVNREDQADAVLKGNVTEADFGPSATVPASQLNPANTLSQSDKFATVLV